MNRVEEFEVILSAATNEMIRVNYLDGSSENFYHIRLYGFNEMHNHVLVFTTAGSAFVIMQVESVTPVTH